MNPLYELYADGKARILYPRRWPMSPEELAEVLGTSGEHIRKVAHKIILMGNPNAIYPQDALHIWQQIIDKSQKKRLAEIRAKMPKRFITAIASPRGSL